MHSHRPRIPLDDLKHPLPRRQSVQFPQNEGMGNPELACKGAAVARDPEFGGDEEARLYGCQADVPGLRRSDKGEKSIGVG